VLEAGRVEVPPAIVALVVAQEGAEVQPATIVGRVARVVALLVGRVQAVAEAARLARKQATSKKKTLLETTFR